eukprot:CAMPEP_0198683720 /NCGR_PEP_ID=MMETSP1468-20131203/11091_1 /TAXON_ID=1461545 /ORGANISM="Mantoniella sp, Strain CCMP1436" /LENGTH=93 /DNA_ID=CAMNT_0044427959 /DNA_START=359 /DNA_END=638 /DNA_ORIENTATION=-
MNGGEVKGSRGHSSGFGDSVKGAVVRSKDLGIIVQGLGTALKVGSEVKGCSDHSSGFGDSIQGAEFKINGEGYGAKSEGFLVQRFRFKANGTW